jgi:hypothetical protein
MDWSTPRAARLCAVTVAAAALSPVAHTDTAAPSPGHPQKPEPLVVRVDDGGFRWGDAGIGAAAGFGAALVLAGGLALAGRSDRVVTHPSQPREEEQ